MSRIGAPYLNDGNMFVLSMVPRGVRRVLDIGCGGGDNARQLRRAHTGIEIVGLTHNTDEARIAAAHMDAVHVVDLEQGLSDAAIDKWGEPFDLLLFSHVLEHLADPVTVLRRCLTRLAPGGYTLIAVPNVLEWRTRMQFLRGRFIYADHGIMDRTHMRFFTYNSASIELISPIRGLELLERQGCGSVPLGPLRRIGVARGLCAAFDQAGVRLIPNFCCREVALLAQWNGKADR